METTKEIMDLECMHSFCKSCLYEWVVYHNGSCPMCRKRIEEPIHFNKNILVFPTSPEIGMTVLFEDNKCFVEECVYEQCIDMEIIEIDQPNGNRPTEESQNQSQ